MEYDIRPTCSSCYAVACSTSSCLALSKVLRHEQNDPPKLVEGGGGGEHMQYIDSEAESSQMLKQ